MINRFRLIVAALAVLAAPAAAQRPVRPLPPPPPPMMISPQAAQAQLVANAGSDSVYFGPGEVNLDGPARQTLVAQAMYLRMNPWLRARINGYSDGRGTRAYSIGIADRRAAAVRNYLVSLGVEPGRLMVVSWGKERPIVAGANEAAWALNRRVQTVIEP
jgi:peptidoglycan-associated lipoprotein